MEIHTNFWSYTKLRASSILNNKNYGNYTYATFIVYKY